MTITLLLADDHPVVREGLAAMLSTEDDFDVVGVASSTIEAVGLAIRTHPDIALIDLEMPPTSGIEAISNVIAVSPKTRILAFTAYKNEERVLGAVNAGAHGYLLKGTPRNEIFVAIRAVHAGATVFEGEVARIVARRLEPAHELLTDRQQEVMQLLIHGLSNREMALRLRISERTVKYHLAAVFDRLGVVNRTEAVAAAMQLGLVHPTEHP